mgnify:CR=1 FL=1
MKLVTKYHGENLLEQTEKLNDDYMFLSLKESIENKDLISYYRQFLKMCKELSNDIVIKDNSLSMAIFIDRMMGIGYFSHKENISKSFEKGEDKELLSKLGISVVCGKAICRHRTAFTKDLFDCSDIFCEDLAFLTSSTSKKETLEGNGNHLANLIKYKDNYYVYDTFNHILFEFRSPIELIEKNSKNNKIFLYYKPEYELLKEKKTLEDIENKLKEFKESSQKDKISLEELTDVINGTTENIISKANHIKEFKEDSREIKKKIYTLCKNI